MITRSTKSQIARAIAELERWLRGGINRTGAMMLNKRTGAVWADLFLDEGSYKIYHDTDIVEIPLKELWWRIPSDSPFPYIAKENAVLGWCVNQMKRGDEQRLNSVELTLRLERMVPGGVDKETDRKLFSEISQLDGQSTLRQILNKIVSGE